MFLEGDFDPFEQCAAGQTKTSHQFDDGKTAAWFLRGGLRPSFLVGGGVGHGNARTVHHFDATAQPQFRRGDPCRQLGGQCLMKFHQPRERQPPARLAISTRAAVWQLVLWRIPGLDFADDLAAGRPRIQHLTQERPEREETRDKGVDGCCRPWGRVRGRRQATTARKSRTTGSRTIAASARIVPATDRVGIGVAAQKDDVKCPAETELNESCASLKEPKSGIQNYLENTKVFFKTLALSKRHSSQLPFIPKQ